MATNYSSSVSGKMVARKDALLTSNILASWLVTMIMEE